MSNDSAFLEILDDGAVLAIEVDGGDVLELQVTQEVEVVTVEPAVALELFVGELNASVYVTDNALTDPNIALLPPGTAIIEID